MALPVPRLERHADTYNEIECATITIQVPTLPHYSSRSPTRSPDVSSIGSSYHGNSREMSEPPRQTMRRGSGLDSDGSSAKDILMHNGHIILMAKESDASYQSHGSASDSLQLSDDLAVHVPLFTKKSCDSGSQQDNNSVSDSLHLSDDFDYAVDMEQTNSQEIPLLVDQKEENARSECGVRRINKTVASSSRSLATTTKEDYYCPLVSSEDSAKSKSCSQLNVLRRAQSKDNGCGQDKLVLDLPKVHDYSSKTANHKM